MYKEEGQRENCLLSVIMSLKIDSNSHFPLYDISIFLLYNPHYQ